MTSRRHPLRTVASVVLAVCGTTRTIDVAAAVAPAAILASTP